MAVKEKEITVSGKKKQKDLNTRLYKACRWNNFAEARLLLDAGADPDVYTNPKSIRPAMTLPHNTPLFTACWHCYYDIASLLLEAGADVNKGLPDGSAPLHMCATEGRIETTEFLLSHGADVNAQDKNGNVPLHLACSRGHVDTLKILLEHGANTAISNKFGKTVVHYIKGLKTNREEILDLLRQYAPEQVMETYCVAGPGSSVI